VPAAFVSAVEVVDAEPVHYESPIVSGQLAVASAERGVVMTQCHSLKGLASGRETAS
jgi:hypothetical protein